MSLASDKNLELQDINLRLFRSFKTYENKVAIKSKQEMITYGELLEEATRYQNYFEKTVKEKGVICVICKRSIKLYSVLLGVVLYGGSYIAFEPDDINDGTIEKIIKMKPNLILTEKMDIEISSLVNLDDINQIMSAEFHHKNRDSEDYLYHIITSGTTGDGKIIDVKDRNFLCYINGYIDAFACKSQDVFFQQSPIYYDGFAEELFGCWADCSKTN